MTETETKALAKKAADLASAPMGVCNEARLPGHLVMIALTNVLMTGGEVIYQGALPALQEAIALLVDKTQSHLPEATLQRSPVALPGGGEVEQITVTPAQVELARSVILGFARAQQLPPLVLCAVLARALRALVEQSGGCLACYRDVFVASWGDCEHSRKGQAKPEVVH